MKRSVVELAGENEIVEIGFTPRSPVTDMVSFARADAATRELAGLAVSMVESAS